MKRIDDGNIRQVGLDDIKIGHRLRAVSGDAVKAILASAEETGITTPIHLRKLPKGFELIDGAHRLEVARQREDAKIAAIVWQATQAEARLMEGTANLATAHISPLDLAVSLADRKRTYLELYPQAAQGASGAERRWNADATETVSFASWMAPMFGVTERRIRQITATGERLSADEARWLRSAPRQVSYNDLTEIGKIADDRERSQVCIALSNGDVKNAAAARQSYAVKNGATPPPQSAVEAEFKTLSMAWKRASKAARRRFLERYEIEVGALLSEVEEASDAAERDHL